jgi:hypothetical protein
MMDNASALPHMPTATTTKDSSSKMAKDHPHDFTKRQNFRTMPKAITPVLPPYGGDDYGQAAF